MGVKFGNNFSGRPDLYIWLGTIGERVGTSQDI